MNNVDPQPISSRKSRLEPYVQQPRLMIMLLVVSLVIIYLLHSQPIFNPVYYALTLFSTLIHESGHSVAALLSGGRVISFTVNSDTSGYTMTAGGSRFLILPAGYLGCAIFGSLFFYLSNRFGWAKLFAFMIGAFVIGITILFGTGSLLAALIAALFGAILIFSAIRGPLWLNMLLVNVITTLTALQGLQAAWDLVSNSQLMPDNDAAKFAQEIVPFMTGNEIAAIWALIAVILFGLAFYFGVVKTLLRSQEQAMDADKVSVTLGK